MFVDNGLVLSNNQAVTVAATSTNSYDTEQAADYGSGSELFVAFKVRSVLTGTDRTMRCAVHHATAEGGAGDELSSVNFTAAEMKVLGNTKYARIAPNDRGAVRRFLNARYTPSGAAAGIAFDAWITPTAEARQDYASGYQVS